MRALTGTEKDTEGFGARLARLRPAGDALAVLFLTGELGAGKTTLVRGFVGALGVASPVRSPTYTLVELYPAGAVTVVHADLYRLRDPSELEPLGLRDWAGPGFLWLIEWPERGAGHLPPADLTLSFSVLEHAHAIDVKAHSALGERWIRQLQRS